MKPGRKEALDAYRRGVLDEALAIQRNMVAQNDPPPEERDFLVLSLVLHTKKDFAAATTVLREGLKRHPESAEMHENLGVFLIAFKDYPIYVDRSVPENLRAGWQQAGAQVIVKEQPPGEPPARKLVWRYEVLAEPGVKRFLVRDADSLLTIKERVAVDDWLRSGKHFHVMRDFRTHTDLVLAGLWGGVGGILPAPAKLWEHFKPWRMENDHVDQDLLTVTAWPTVRQSCLIHDSVFTGCLGSVPFPPYGELPARHHVGQNAFIHFQKSK